MPGMACSGILHHHFVRAVIRHRLLPVGKPRPHHLDLVGLRDLDAQREHFHVVALCAGLEQLDHLDRLRVVANHALHEFDVGRCKRLAWRGGRRLCAGERRGR
jgi:hypothetical protein